MNEKAEKFLKSMHILGNKYIYIVLLVGVVFMLFAGGNQSAEKVEEPAGESFSEAQILEETISKIKGVGAVSVMVTYYSGVENDLAFETKKSSNQKEADGTVLDEESIDTKAVMSDGAPVVVRKLYPEVKGVGVVAEGAGDVKVKKSIQDAVVTALDVAVHKVCVLEKNQ